MNISFETMVELRGPRRGRRAAPPQPGRLPRAAPSTPAARGIIIADTKFEWGRVGGELILIDEVLTPDSSRFWPLDDVRSRAASQPSFDKQFVRDWLETTGWDKNSPPPAAARRRAWPRREPSTSKPTSG